MARLFSTNSRQRASFASMPITHFSVSALITLAVNSIASSSLSVTTGIVTFNSKFPVLAAERDRRIAADDMSRNLDNRFAENRIDFARHDRRTGLCVRHADLADRAAGSRSKPT